MALSPEEAVANRVRPIALSDADRAGLERLYRASSTPAGLSRRVRTVLLMGQGLTGVEIAERVGYTAVQVSRLRRRFAETGVAGLYERPRSGRPPTIPPRQRARVVALTLQLPGGARAHCTTRHTGAEFLGFLKLVTRRYRGRELHIILDNSSTHSTPAVQAWLAAHPWVQFHFTPKGASWLNMVEAWFSILTRKSVRRGSFETVRALVRHIERYIDEWNSHPTPFVWTKEPADIIKKAVRCAR